MWLSAEVSRDICAQTHSRRRRTRSSARHRSQAARRPPNLQYFRNLTGMTPGTFRRSHGRRVGDERAPVAGSPSALLAATSVGEVARRPDEGRPVHVDSVDGRDLQLREPHLGRGESRLSPSSAGNLFSRAVQPRPQTGSTGGGVPGRCSRRSPGRTGCSGRERCTRRA